MYEMTFCFPIKPENKGDPHKKCDLKTLAKINDFDQNEIFHNFKF